MVEPFTLRKASTIGPGAKLLVADERGMVAATVVTVGPSKSMRNYKYVRLADGLGELLFDMDEMVVVSQ